jgi:hypothetical protein
MRRIACGLTSIAFATAAMAQPADPTSTIGVTLEELQGRTIHAHYGAVGRWRVGPYRDVPVFIDPYAIKDRT